MNHDAKSHRTGLDSLRERQRRSAQEARSLPRAPAHTHPAPTHDFDDYDSSIDEFYRDACDTNLQDLTAEGMGFDEIDWSSFDFDRE